MPPSSILGAPAGSRYDPCPMQTHIIKARLAAFQQTGTQPCMLVQGLCWSQNKQVEPSTLLQPAHAACCRKPWPHSASPPALRAACLQMVNHAAVSELLKEAEIMARLRHPNIVWVYGVVLPPPQEPQEDEDDEEFDTPLPGEGPFEIGAACHVGHCLAAAGMALAAAATVGTASLPWD